MSYHSDLILAESEPKRRNATEQKRIDDYRAMLDWLESHPEVPMPYLPSVISHWFYGDDKLAQLKKLVRKLGKVEKKFLGGTFTVRKNFGSVHLDFDIDREAICEKVVTGTREVAEYTVPAHTEDVTEWRCTDSTLLKGVSE